MNVIFYFSYYFNYENVIIYISNNIFYKLLLSFTHRKLNFRNHILQTQALCLVLFWRLKNPYMK